MAPSLRTPRRHPNPTTPGGAFAHWAIWVREVIPTESHWLLDYPDDGAIEFNGLNTGDLTERERDALRGRSIGFIFQQSHMLPNRTVLANVALGLRTLGEPRSESVAAAEDALARVGLSHRALARAGDLSGGERQRAGIARALVAEPSLVLADEPTGNLDMVNSLAVLQLLKEVPNSERAVVVVTHDDRVAGIADRQVVLVDGRLA